MNSASQKLFKNNNNEKRINFEVDLTQTQKELKENTKIQNKKNTHCNWNYAGDKASQMHSRVLRL